MPTKESYWATTSKLNELYVFRFNKDNNYTVKIPENIDYLNYSKIIPSLNSLYCPFFIQGYDIGFQVYQGSIYVDFRIQRSNEAYRETRYSETGYFYWEETTKSSHRFPQGVSNISFHLVASGLLNESGVTKLFMDLTINGKFFKRIEGSKNLGTIGQERFATIELEETVDISSLSLGTENTLDITYGRLVNGVYKAGIVFSGVNGSMLDYIFYNFDPDAPFLDAKYMTDVSYEIDLLYFHSA